MSSPINFKDSLIIFGLLNLKGQNNQSLRQKYKQLANKYHPDKGGTNQQFINLREAYNVLRRAINDPDFEATQTNYGKTDSTHQESYQKYSTNPDYDQKQTASLQEQIRIYQQAYQKANKMAIEYEKVINNNIQQIQKLGENINSIIKIYNQTIETYQTQLTQKLASLQKERDRVWWEYIIPIPKLDHKQYLLRYNQIIESYNQANKILDKQFTTDLLSAYKQNYENMIDEFSKV